MNKVFKIIFSRCRGCWVVTSEVSKSVGRATNVGDAGKPRSPAAAAAARGVIYAAALPPALLCLGFSPSAQASGLCLHDIATSQLYGTSYQTGVSSGCNVTGYSSVMSGSSWAVLASNTAGIGIMQGQISLFLDPTGGRPTMF